MKARDNSPSMTKENERYQVEDDLRCLQRAATIKKDAKRMAKVRALAREQLTALKAVAEKE